ncbi:MAG: AAA family ATPase, partial [Rhodoferax sp.]|nr:AAA family ATPase [Rhodoferax sp.]
MLALRLLGPLELWRDGQALPLPVRKVAALLVLLALGGRATRARIVALLWPDLDESTGRRNLRRELARMRDTGVAEAVVADGDWLALAPGVDVDVARLDAMPGDLGPDMALALWRGRPIDGLDLDDAPPFAEWLTAERERLQARWRGAAVAAAGEAEAGGRTDAALAWLDRLLADDPLQERHHRAVMRVLAAAGRREAALQRFDRCRSLLQAELGLAPMAETEALAASLRTQAGAPPAPAVAEPVPPDLPDRPALLPDRLPFVGREAEVAWLERAWRAGGTLLVEGDGGVGKSRLVLDFVAARGPHAVLRCRPGDAELPLSSAARLLRALAGPVPALDGLPPWVPAELARLMPELGPAPPPLRTEAERVRLGQAVVAAWQAWAGGNFDAVVFDDWHLADPASQALLAALSGAEAAGVRQVLVYRPELTPAAEALVRSLRAAGAPHLLLPPLPPPAVLELVRRLSGVARPERFSALLSRATAGHPFYVAETLHHLVDTGLLTAGAGGVWQTPYDDAT